MNIFLTEDEATMLLQAACENQVTLRADIEKISNDPDFDRSDVYHFRAKLNRYEDMIRKVEQRLAFPSSPEKYQAKPLGHFDGWDEMPGGF